MSVSKLQLRSSADLRETHTPHDDSGRTASHSKMPHFPPSDTRGFRLRMPEEKKDWFAAFNNNYRVQGLDGKLVKKEASAQKPPTNVATTTSPIIASPAPTVAVAKTLPNLHPEASVEKMSTENKTKRHSSLKKPSLGTWQEGQEVLDASKVGPRVVDRAFGIQTSEQSRRNVHASPPSIRSARDRVHVQMTSSSDSNESATESFEELCFRLPSSQDAKPTANNTQALNAWPQGALAKKTNEPVFAL